MDRRKEEIEGEEQLPWIIEIIQKTVTLAICLVPCLEISLSHCDTSHTKTLCGVTCPAMKMPRNVLVAVTFNKVKPTSTFHNGCSNKKFATHANIKAICSTWKRFTQLMSQKY